MDLCISLSVKLIIKKIIYTQYIRRIQKIICLNSFRTCTNQKIVQHRKLEKLPMIWRQYQICAITTITKNSVD